VRYRNGDRLIGHGRVDLRTDALAIVEAGLGAADPGVQLAGAIRREGDRLLVHGAAAEAPGARRPQGHEVVDLGGRRLFLVGAGKATLGMAVVLDRLLGPLLVGVEQRVLSRNRLIGESGLRLRPQLIELVINILQGLDGDA